MLYFCVVIYAAAIYVRPGEIVPALAGVPILDYLSGIVAVVALGSFALAPRKFWDQPQDKLLLAYYGAIMISNPVNGWLGGGPMALSAFFPVVFCYYLIRLGLRTPKQITRFTTVFVWLNIFLAVNGLLQIFTGAGFGQVEPMQTNDGIRIQGTGIFNDPNDLGMTLVMAVPFVLSRTFGAGSRFFSRVFGLLAMSVLIAACFYTNSRGTILGLGAVFTCFVYRRYGPFSATLLGALGLAALLALGPSRMSELSSEEDSAQGRIQAWSEGLQMFRAAPVFGVGYQNFTDYHSMVAHNAFVHVLAELGILGAMAFVGMFYYYFLGLQAQPRDDKRLWQLNRNLFDSGVGLVACIMFLSRQYVVVPFMFLALGACLVSAGNNGNGARPDSIGHIVAVPTITVTLVVVFYLIVRLFANY